jgi:hypothetical protein
VTLPDTCRYWNGNFIASWQRTIRRCQNDRAERHSCLAGPDPQVGQPTRFIGVFCVHRLALSALKFFLPCLPEVRADPNIVNESRIWESRIWGHLPICSKTAR